MPQKSKDDAQEDPFDLARFTRAQDVMYATALEELRLGHKRTHWMWYIFPQIAGLGSSANARFYAVQSLEEAQAYLDHPVLGEHLQECAAALLAVEGLSALEILGTPDDLKLHSSMTLFAQAAGPDSVFAPVLEKYFDGEADDETLQRL